MSRVSGITKDTLGNVLPTCICSLFKDNLNGTCTFIAQVTSDSVGAYIFSGLADTLAQYFVVAWRDDSPHVFDVTDHILRPVDDQGEATFTGVGALTMVGSSTATGDMSITGTGDAQLTSSNTVSGALSATGTADVQMMSDFGSAAITMTGSGVVTMVGSSQASGAVSATGTGVETMEGGGAFTFVTGSQSTGDVASLAVTAGNLVVVYHITGGSGSASPTISDGVNSWTQIAGSPLNDATNGDTSAWWWCIAATTATLTITIANTGAFGDETGVGQWSIPSGAVADGGNSVSNVTGSAATDGDATGSVTTTGTGDLILSAIFDANAFDTVLQFTPGTGFTDRPTMSRDPGGASPHSTFHIEQKIQSAAGAINPTWTAANTNNFGGMTAAFKTGLSITPDAVASGSIATNSALTISMTVGTLVNGALIVGVGYLDAVAGSASITSVTYNGVAMTLVTGSLQTAVIAGAFDSGVAHYVLANPASGTHNIVITMSESCDAIYGGGQSFANVHQTVITGTAAIATGTNTTPSVNVSSATSEIPVSVVLALDDTGAFASGDTEKWRQGFGAGLVGTGSSVATGAGTVTMDWSGSTSGIEWVISAVSLKPA